MQKLIIIISIFFVTTVYSQKKWSDNSVKTIDKGRKEIGVFSPLKLGLKDSLEVTVHPIAFLLIPNIELKKYWKSFGFFELATKHKISYPTLLYNVISRNGVGGILPPTSDIPQMIKFNNAVMLGKTINEFITLTINSGIDLTLTFSEGDFPEIEYHIVYPRTYSYNNMFVPYLGANIIINTPKNITLTFDYTGFFLTKNNAGIISEFKTVAQWNINDKLAIKAGIFYTYGDYPYGKGSGLFPIIDLLYGF